MKIFIITMEDPILTIPFIKEIIINRQNDICGLALVKKGNRLTTFNKQSKLSYIISLLIILGPFYFIENGFKLLMYKRKKQISELLKTIVSPDIISFCERRNIPSYVINNPNDAFFISELEKFKPDIIINQSQSIIKKKLLSVPEIGILNRHNALLPKNRGRLTPFWVKFKNEKETGVSIHFVTNKLDSGPIIVQKRFEVTPQMTIRQIVKKNYSLAPYAMLEAIEKLENGFKDFIDNNDEEATYNSIPTLKQAWEYRKRRLFG